MFLEVACTRPDQQVDSDLVVHPSSHKVRREKQQEQSSRDSSSPWTTQLILLDSSAPIWDCASVPPKLLTDIYQNPGKGKLQPCPKPVPQSSNIQCRAGGKYLPTCQSRKDAKIPTQPSVRNQHKPPLQSEWEGRPSKGRTKLPGMRQANGQADPTPEGAQMARRHQPFLLSW